jgi:hypothetical protein
MKLESRLAVGGEREEFRFLLHEQKARDDPAGISSRGGASFPLIFFEKVSFSPRNCKIKGMLPFMTRRGHHGAHGRDALETVVWTLLSGFPTSAYPSSVAHDNERDGASNEMVSHVELSPQQPAVVAAVCVSPQNGRELVHAAARSSLACAAQVKASTHGSPRHSFR